MFKLNFKIAFRNILKNKSSSIINVAGLAIGLSSCLLLLLYAKYEWNYDRQFKDSRQIHQVMTNIYNEKQNVVRTINLSANSIAATLKEKFPDIEKIARTTDSYKRLLKHQNNSFKIESRYADPDFLKIFDYKFVAGNPDQALRDPNSIIITESLAMRLFGTKEALNKILNFEDQVNLKVTGIIKDLPQNVTYHFEALAPWSLFENLNVWPSKTNWGNHSFYTLLKINKHANINLLNYKLKGLVKQNFSRANEDVFIYPLNQLHLYGEFVNGKGVNGRIQEVRIFTGIAIGILIIACFNFMNMATAQSQKRAKEVGIKKTIGAAKKTLIFQFLLESFLITSISILFSIAIVELSLPWFNNLLDIDIKVNLLDPEILIIVLILLLVTSLAAGMYPAFFLSSFSPAKNLKANSQSGNQVGLRQILVIIQFSFSIVLIACTITIYKQLQFIKNRPLGYQSSGLVEIPHEGLLYMKYDLLKSRLIASQAVISVTQSSNSISRKESSIRGLEWPGMLPSGKEIDFDQIYTTSDFIKTTGITMVEGRDFSEQMASDTAAIMLSEKAVKTMNLSRPIGAQIKYQGAMRTVTGVFKDFVWGNQSKQTDPMVIAYASDISDAITMRLNPDQSLAKSVAGITNILKELNPNFPIDIRFIDQLNDEKLKSEATIASISNVFGGLSIFISCMGLFGLSAYMAEQRTKEIGIRKVLGATIQELMQMLSIKFMKLVAIAIVLSVPFAWYLMNRWLLSFEIHTQINLWIFVVTAAVTIIVALLTVSWQTFIAATINPVKALKQD
jgi:putative ABC transport system permease protein